MFKEKNKRRIRKITAFAAAMAMAVSITVPSDIFSNIDLGLTASAEEITSTAPQTNKIITAWQWIDEEEILDEETGILALPGASEQTPAYFADVTALLPTQILAMVGNAEDTEAESEEKIITLKEWLCEDYPETGAYSGSYTFTATLPESWVLDENTSLLTVTVELGGAQVYSTTDVWNGSVASSFAGGSGTEEDPYQIATGAQFAYFRKLINATTYNSNTYATAYYKLTADIDLNNKTWTDPIGKGSSIYCCFNGYFDGNNKTISNLSSSYGLFYKVGGDVTIKDLTIENINISGSSYIGGLVYMVDSVKGTSAHISNCHISGTITSTYAAVGLVYRADSPLTIEDCSNSAEITGQSYSAGILGQNYTKTTFDDYFVIIRNCTNSGKIVNTSTSSSGGAAGIAGSLQYDKTLIENCVNTGEIVAQNGGNKYAGIVSYSESTAGNTIRNCENYGDVTCDVAKTNIYTAGICAFGAYTEIYDCSNVGTIHNHESALYCGGIIARRGSSSDTARGSVYNCLNSGTIEPSYGGQIIGSEDTLSNVYDNFYVNGNLAANSVNNQNNYRVSQEQAESGYLAFVMNGLTSGNVWKQKLGTDIYPKINGSEDIVYANGNCSAKVTEYSNTPLTMDANNNHDLIQVSASNADCGHNGYKEHYECKSCNAFFENGTGDTPVRKKDFITGMATGNHQSYDANGLCAVCGNAYEKPGTDENGFYVIKNTGNFIWYANAINNYNYISIPVGDAEIQLDGFDAKLDADIDLSLVYNEESGKSWTPIAYDYSKYLNELDGQGHTINGLYINSASLNYAGLVETMYYKTAYIHDIVFTNVNINAPRADYVGTVTGKMESLKTAPCIENCIVKSGTINGKTYVGGLVGYVCSNNADKFQQENKNIINNCANFANVNSTSYAGGLVGYTEANGKNVNIANCYNVGEITGTTSGDITGKISENTSVVNCYYLGSTAFGENAVSATAEQKTAEQFESGEVAYLLNGSTSEGTLAWGQALTGETPDEYPVLGGAKVYQVNVYEGCEGKPGDAGIGYSNTDAAVYAKHNLSPINEKTVSCTEDGYKAHYKCDICNKLFTDENGTTETTLEAVTIPAAHTISHIDANDPTCTKSGNTEHYKCDVCGKLFTDENGTTETTLEAVTIPAAHTISHIDANDPTCTKSGNIEHYKCSVCNKLFADKNGETELTLKEVEIAAHHSFGEDWESDKDNHWHICKVCGMSEAEAHTRDSGTVTKEATPTENGTITYSCSVCGASMGEETITATISSFEVTASGVVVKYTVTGSTAVKSQTVKFSEVTEEMVELMKSKDIQLVIDFVNYSTAGSDTVILTSAQMKAIEYVLEYDFGIAA